MVMNQIACKNLFFAMCSVYQYIHNFCGSGLRLCFLVGEFPKK